MSYLFFSQIPFEIALWSAGECCTLLRPKARGLAQHGGPPGWLEESDLAGVILYAVILYVVDGKEPLVTHA